MQVVATAAQPTLQFDVASPDRTPLRMTVSTGTVDVVQPDSGKRFRVVSSDPNGVPVGFYVGDPQTLPIAGSVAVAEAGSPGCRSRPAQTTRSATTPKP